MPENEIIDEIHRFRADLTRQCDYDVHRLLTFYQKLEEEKKTEGLEVVSFMPPGKEPRNATEALTG